MTTLLIRLSGPMQSWGTSSRFSHREAGREPSKSGVIGMLCAALGRRRTEPVDDLARLEMGVRIDRPGILERDFQTAMEVPRAGNSGNQTVISERFYLADADFLVGLSGAPSLLREAHEALRVPRWPLFLGRKGYVPGHSPFLERGLVELPLVDALRTYEWPTTRQGDPMPEVEAVLETELGDVRRDVPISFELGQRRFGSRRVRRSAIHPLREEA